MIPVELLLERGAVYRKCDANEVVFSEGMHAAFYYQLISGRVRWASFSEDGKEVLHRIAEAGECFGEFSLFDGEPYAASAIADIPSVMLKLSVESFQRLLAEFPAIHFSFTKSLVQHLRFKFFLSNLQASNNPETIISGLIDYFNQHDKFVCQDCNRLMLTRQELANMAGLRVETVIRAIKNMEKGERISIVRGKVFVPADGL